MTERSGVRGRLGQHAAMSAPLAARVQRVTRAHIHVQRHVTGRAVRQLNAPLAALQRVRQLACVGGGIRGMSTSRSIHRPMTSQLEAGSNDGPVTSLHRSALRAAHRRRQKAGAPPHAVAHHQRGIGLQFAALRAAGRGAFVAFLAVLGPGLLAGLSDDDPAGITTYSVLGADYGYSLLWIIPASTILLVQFHLMAVRLGAATGKGFVGIIRERWGRGGDTSRCRAAVRQLRNDLRGVRGHLGRRRRWSAFRRGSARRSRAC